MRARRQLLRAQATDRRLRRSPQPPPRAPRAQVATAAAALDAFNASMGYAEACPASKAPAAAVAADSPVADQLPSLAELSERLRELAACQRATAAAAAAVQAYGDSMGYAQPGQGRTERVSACWGFGGVEQALHAGALVLCTRRPAAPLRPCSHLPRPLLPLPIPAGRRAQACRRRGRPC